MEEGKTKLNEAVSEKEKEAIEIFSIPFIFPDIVIENYAKGKKDEKKRRENLVVYAKEINIKISEAEQEGEGTDVEKIVRAFLKSKKANAVSRLLKKATRKDNGKEKVGIEQETAKTEKKVERKDVEIAETKDDDIRSKVNNLIESIKIKLGAAQVSGLILKEELEKFEKIFNDKLDGLNGILKGKSSGNSEAKLNEFYEDLLKLKDIFFRPAKNIEAKQIEKVEERKEKYKKKKNPSAKTKPDKFYQRKENLADESLTLEKDPSNPGQHFDFIDEEKEIEYRNEIKEINDFDEFYEAIKKIGRMKNNSGNIISAEQVMNKIEKTRKSLRKKAENFNQGDKELDRLWKEHLNLIPKICGISNKTGELIREEIYGKAKEKKIEKSEKEFTEREKEAMGVFVGYANKFQEDMEAKADWSGYSDEEKNDTLGIQIAVSIRLKINEKNLFEGKEDQVIKMILESKM